MKRWSIAAAVVLAATLCAACTEDKNVYDLRPLWRVDDKWYVEFTSDENTTLRDRGPAGETTKVRRVRTVGYWHTVKAVAEDGTATIELQVDRLVLAGGETNIVYRFDSDGPSGSMPAGVGAVFDAVRGPVFEIEVNPHGAVRMARGIDELRRAAEGAASDRDGQAVVQQLKWVLDNDGQLHTWQQHYGCFAFDSVRAGDTWKRSYPLTQGTYQVTYRLHSVREEGVRKVGVVKYSAALSPCTPFTQNGLAFAPSKGDGEGRCRVDFFAMRVLEGQESGRIEGVMHGTNAETGEQTDARVTGGERVETRVLTPAQRAAEKRR
jgi:hypothetical protein